MKLIEIFQNDNGLALSFMAGCYQRHLHCDFTHSLKTSLCKHELEREDLNEQESQALRKAISQYNYIQSPRVYHFGRVGIHEFRRQLTSNEGSFSNSFDLKPPEYTPENCQELKRRAELIPFDFWGGMSGIKAATTLLEIACLLLLFRKGVEIKEPIVEISKKIVEHEKLAAGLLAFFTTSHVISLFN